MNRREMLKNAGIIAGVSTVNMFSRLMVATESSITAAVSSTARPLKNRNSTMCAWRVDLFELGEGGIHGQCVGRAGRGDAEVDLERNSAPRSRF